MGNDIGVEVDGVPDVAVGGLEPGLGNLISGNGVGVQVTRRQDASLALGDQIAGNVIGLDVSGTRALGNVFGVFLNDAVGVTIGGITPGARNVISGNTGVGVQVFRVSLGGSGNLIEGNIIGLDASGPGRAVRGRPADRDLPQLRVEQHDRRDGRRRRQHDLGQHDRQSRTPELRHLDLRPVGRPGPGQRGRGQPDRPRRRREPVADRSMAARSRPIGVAINTSSGNVIGGLTARPATRSRGTSSASRSSGSSRSSPATPTGNVIVGDTIDFNTFGVFLNGASGNSVVDDDLSLNTSIGLSIVGSLATGNTATGNTIDGNLEHGVYIESAASNTSRAPRRT